MLIVYALTQHAGLGEDVLDHRLNTRTVKMNVVNGFLYWNMNYHVEHHMSSRWSRTTGCPSCTRRSSTTWRRPTRRSWRPTGRSSRRSCASPRPGLLHPPRAAARRRALLPAQRRPRTAGPGRWPRARGLSARGLSARGLGARGLRRSRSAQWVAACRTSDIDPEDVIPFNHAGRAYAIYRSPGDRFYATDGHCAARADTALRRPGHGRRDQVPDAQRPVRLHHRPGARRTVLATRARASHCIDDGTVYLDLG